MIYIHNIFMARLLQVMLAVLVVCQSCLLNGSELLIIDQSNLAPKSFFLHHQPVRKVKFSHTERTNAMECVQQRAFSPIESVFIKEALDISSAQDEANIVGDQNALAQEEALYVYDSNMKKTFIQRLKYRNGLLNPKTPEYDQLYEEVNDIFKDLLRAAGIHAELYLMDNQGVNAAAAIYFNFVIINIGLFQELKKENILTKDLIAFILAHEIVHLIQYREDVQAGKVKEIPVELTSDELLKKKFHERPESYAREYDADTRALRLVNDTGFNLMEVTRFFEMLVAQGPASQLGRVLRVIFDEHPEPVKRIENLKKIRETANWKETQTSHFISKTAIDQIDGPRSDYRRAQQSMLTVQSYEEMEKAIDRAQSIEELEIIHGYSLDALAVYMVGEMIPKWIDREAFADELRRGYGVIDDEEIARAVQDRVDREKTKNPHLYSMMERLYNFQMANDEIVHELKCTNRYRFAESRQSCNIFDPGEFIQWLIVNAIATGSFYTSSHPELNDHMQSELEILNQMFSEPQFEALVQRLVKLAQKFQLKLEALSQASPAQAVKVQIFQLGQSASFAKDDFVPSDKVFPHYYYREQIKASLDGKSRAELLEILSNCELFYEVGFDSIGDAFGRQGGRGLKEILIKWNEFNKNLMKIYIVVLSSQILDTPGEWSLDDLLALGQIFEEKQKAWFYDISYNFTHPSPIEQLVQKIIEKARELGQEHRAFQFFINNHIFSDSSENMVGDFVYQQLVQHPDDEIAWKLINNSHLRSAIENRFKKAIQNKDNQNILFISEYQEGQLLNILNHLHFKTLHNKNLDPEQAVMQMINDLMERNVGQPKRQAQIWKNVLESVDQYHVIQKQHKRLESNQIYKAYWNFVQGLDLAVLRDEMQVILREYGFDILVDELDRSVMEFIYFFYHGGIHDVISFREHIQTFFHAKVAVPQLQLLAKFFNNPHFVERQHNRGMLQEFDVRKIEEGEYYDKNYSLYPSKISNMPAVHSFADSTMVDNAFYRAYSWEEYIVFYNVAVWLQTQGQAEKLQKLLDLKPDSTEWMMFLGEITSGNIDLLQSELLQEVINIHSNPAQSEEFMRYPPSDTMIAKKDAYQVLPNGMVFLDLHKKKSVFRKRIIKFFESRLKRFIFARPQYMTRTDLTLGTNEIQLLALVNASTKSFDEMLSEMTVYLPKSIFRNHILWALFNREILIRFPDCRKGFLVQPEQLRQWLADRERRGLDNAAIYGLLQKITPLLMTDKRLNFINMALFDFMHKKRLRMGQATGVGETTSWANIEKYPKLFQLWRWPGLLFQYFILKAIYTGHRVSGWPRWGRAYKVLSEKFLFAREVYMGFEDQEFDFEYRQAQIENHVREVILAWLHRDHVFMRGVRYILLSFYRWLHPGKKLKDFLFFNYDEKTTQINTMMGSFAQTQLERDIQSVNLDFDEKVKRIQIFFPDGSPTRDYFLDLLLQYEMERTADKDEAFFQSLKTTGSLFYQPQLKERYALTMLSLDEDLHPGQFDTVQKKVDKITSYFESGYTRDDILMTILEEVAHIDDYQYIRQRFYQYKGDILESKVSKKVFLDDRIDIWLDDIRPQDRKELMLWILGAQDKPLFLQEYEVQLGVDFDRIRNMCYEKPDARYPYVGRSMKKKLIEKIFIGSNGVSADQKQFNQFIEAVFEKYVPSGMVARDKLRVIFKTVLEQSSPTRRLEIFQGLSLQIMENQYGAMSEAQVIKGFFESIGLIGIKLGQVLAHAADVEMPESMRSVLKTLSSQADPLSKMVAFDSVEHLYPGGFRENFEYIGESIGSASIKVVFRARKKGADHDIALKIKRPKVDQLLEDDLEFLKNILITLREKGLSVPIGLEDQVSNALHDDVDFGLESEIAGQFEHQLSEMQAEHAYQLEDGTLVEISVAKIHYVVGEKIMEAELVGGYSFHDLDQLIGSGALDATQVKSLKKILFDYLMEQMFRYGFYNADPHGGNFHLLKQDGMLKIVFIDTGSAESVRVEKEEFFNLLESLMWLKFYPTRPVPKRFLYASVFFKKIGYLMDEISPEEVLELIFSKMSKVGFLMDEEPQQYIARIKGKFLIEVLHLSGGQDFSITDQLIKVRQAMQAKAYAEAMVILQSVLDYDPNHAEALSLTDQIYWLQTAHALSVEEEELKVLLAELDSSKAVNLRNRYWELAKSHHREIPRDVLEQHVDRLTVNFNLARKSIISQHDWIKKKHQKEAIKRIAFFLSIRSIESESAASFLSSHYGESTLLQAA